MQSPTAFLNQFRPGGPWMLTAIPADGGRTETATFSDTQIANLDKWLKAHRDKNIYFAVNPTIEPMDTKARREDIARVEYLHVDVDPEKDKPLKDEQDRILTTLQAATPAPTFIVFSGGGYQAFWRLIEPIEIGGNLSRAEEAKRYNVQLEILYGGDNCHNIDRIMRLPGTTNWPSAKKRAAGREKAEAALVCFQESNSYSLSMFTAAQPVQSTQGAGFTSTAPELVPSVSGNVRRLASVDDLPDTVRPRVKVLIVQGNDPDDPTKWPSRSERLFAVCCALVRSGVPDDVIFSVITDPDFKISESVLELGSRSEAYALRQIKQAKEVAIAPELREMNSKHAVISSMGGKCRVISLEWDHTFGRQVIAKQSFEDIRNRYMHRQVQVGENKDGVPIYIPLGKWWLQHQLRTQYETIEFVPGQDVPGCYNLWQGFTCEARPGTIDRYLSHVRNIICGECDAYYDYLIKWMASTVQNPAQVGSTAVVLRGKQGTGKSFFVKSFGKLFGEHFLQVTNSKHLVGSFNAHLRNCVVLFADEAFYAGDRQNESVLKGLITEELIAVEPKGVDVELKPNYLHIIMASNSEWVVPAAMDDRRFFVLDVAADRKEDSAYFRGIQEELNNGGYEALLYFLSNLPLGDFDVRRAPKTEALQEQKELTLRPDESWWYDKLQDGRLLDTHSSWKSSVPRELLFADLVNYIRIYMGGTYMSRASKHKLTKFLRRVCPLGHPALKSVRMEAGQPGTDFDLAPLCYVFPPLDECRKAWEHVVGFESKWQYVAPADGPEPQYPF